ncbi:MAG: hypothetical protein K5660_07825 [Paludibacteraceae bacterium]|nr:hypothetical protein [Paludibacteraceae bacterium]
MSYKRTYRKTIRIPYSGSVSYSYGPSQSGGSGTAYYSGTAEEEVEVDIEVDTVPFDNSVAACNRHVDVLTGSVVATQTAQVASIRQKAKQIGDTVVNGFFNTVRFEISTQIVELQKRVEALLLDIKEKQKKLLALKTQMEKDYHRVSEQYGKIFGELNQELDNRVHALDQPVFSTANEMYLAEDRFMQMDMLNVVALSGKENALLDAQIGTALTKRHAQHALIEANTFLAKKQATELILEHCKIDDNREQRFYAPVCYASTTDEHNVINAQAYASGILPQDISGKVIEQVQMDSIPDMSDEEKENIDVFFKTLVNETDASDEHAARVKNIITKLYSL